MSGATSKYRDEHCDDDSFCVAGRWTTKDGDDEWRSDLPGPRGFSHYDLNRSRITPAQRAQAEAELAAMRREP